MAGARLHRSARGPGRVPRYGRGHRRRSEVELPDYFAAATVPGSATVHLTMQLPDEPLDREVPSAPPPSPVPPLALAPESAPVTLPESEQIHGAAASVPDANGRFRISSTAPDGTRFVWLVKATRADGPPLTAEPLRSEVSVRGDGPYRHITPREAAA
jgi:hypothetical protein